MCSLDSSRRTPRVLFQNADCFKRFGPPRSQVGYLTAMGTLTEEAQFSRQQWLLKVSQVNLGPNCNSCMIPRIALAMTICKQHHRRLANNTTHNVSDEARLHLDRPSNACFICDWSGSMSDQIRSSPQSLTHVRSEILHAGQVYHSVTRGRPCAVQTTLLWHQQGHAKLLNWH